MFYSEFEYTNKECSKYIIPESNMKPVRDMYRLMIVGSNK
jgi:hypothetical protein